MKMRAAIVALTLLLSVSVAADFDDGVAAYGSDGYKKAFKM